MSTGPSETRKSLQALTTDVAELVNSTRPVGKRKLLELQHALEALAASEPVATAAVSVDDAMVQRAEEAFWPVYLDCISKAHPKKPAHKSGMRAALTAALDPQVKR